MRLEPPQIVRSAQIWVCDTCGGHDHKSCGCNSTAHLEELAAKREQARQRKIKQRESENPNEINVRVTRDTDVENIEEIDDEPGDDDQTIWRRGLIYRAKSAQTAAQFEGWSQFKVDRQLVEEANEAAASWRKLADHLERLYHDKAS